MLPRIGARVAIANGARGFVRFAGQTQFKPGLWVGVELDDALGKGDGSVQGHTYFRCAPLHGIFVMPSTLQMLDDRVEEPPDVSAGMTSADSLKPANQREEPGMTSADSLNPASQHEEPVDDHLSEKGGSRSESGLEGTELSPGRLCDGDTEGIAALHEMYGADWCNPALYSSQKKKKAQNNRLDRTPEQEVEISDITERLSFSGGHRKADTTHAEAGVSFADEHRLLYTAMDGLRMAAESAIARAETAEAKLSAQSASLASPTDIGSQKALAEEVKVVIAAEIKKAVQVAVDEATAELRAAVAEAKQLREIVKPSANMIGDFHAALALTQGSKLERNKINMYGEDDRDRESEAEGRHALMMMAMKAIAHQVLESGSKGFHVSPSISTDDTHSSATLTGASRTQSLYSSMSSRTSSAGNSPSRSEKANDVVEVSGSARLVPAREELFLGSETLKEAPLPMTPAKSAESFARDGALPTQVRERSPSSLSKFLVKSDSLVSPQRSEEVTADDLEPPESRRVRDVVSQFERILPGGGRDQNEGPLAPWPFAPVPRSKNFSIAATPWTTLSSAVRRPARSASVSAIN